MSTFIASEGGKMPVLPILIPGDVHEDGSFDLVLANLNWSNGAIIVQKDRVLATIPAEMVKRRSSGDGPDMAGGRDIRDLVTLPGNK